MYLCPEKENGIIRLPSPPRSFRFTLTTPLCSGSIAGYPIVYSSGTTTSSSIHLVPHLIVVSSVAMHAVVSPRNTLFPVESWYVEPRQMRKSSLSCTKYIERQAIRAWKRMTGAAHRHQRASKFLPNGFILVTSRRRSVMFA
ncbi:hypothetical protein V8B97DRAFT_2021021 [Scleroderma yunnanense]